MSVSFFLKSHFYPLTLVDGESLNDKVSLSLFIVFRVSFGLFLIIIKWGAFMGGRFKAVQNI